ncbi:MAG: tetratricopeptide repeat protein [Bacteroidia bacterium]
MFKTNLFIFIFCISLSSFINANETQILLDSANNAYSKGQFEKAIKGYEAILASNLEAAEIYFNLGNAYYKSNNLAYAILNYERAIKLNPDNEDFQFNLKLANQRVEDQVDAAPVLFLTQWKNSLISLMTEKGWSQLCILFIILSLSLFALFVITQNRNLKQIGFFGGSITIVLSILTFFIASSKYKTTICGTEAIITAPSITVTGSPSEKGTKLFIIHEGIKVNITQEEADWVEIKIANGNIGWVKASQLARI